MSMRLHRNQINKLVEDIVELLTVNNQHVLITQRDEQELAIENEERAKERRKPLPASMLDEFKKDVSSVLYNYVNTDRRLTETARDEVKRRDQHASMTYSIKRDLAKQEKFKLGDEAPGFIVEQLIETFMRASSVDDIFAADHDIKATLLPEIRKTMNNQRSVQQEMKNRVKAIAKRSNTWEDQYFVVSQRLKDLYQLDAVKS